MVKLLDHPKVRHYISDTERVPTQQLSDFVRIDFVVRFD